MGIDVHDMGNLTVEKTRHAELQIRVCLIVQTKRQNALPCALQSPPEWPILNIKGSLFVFSMLISGILLHNIQSMLIQNLSPIMLFPNQCAKDSAYSLYKYGLTSRYIP